MRQMTLVTWERYLVSNTDQKLLAFWYYLHAMLAYIWRDFDLLNVWSE